MNGENNSGLEINDEVLKKLEIGIFLQEKKHIKTKKKTEREMVETIRKMIMSEVDKNDN